MGEMTTTVVMDPGAQQLEVVEPVVARVAIAVVYLHRPAAGERGRLGMRAARSVALLEPAADAANGPAVHAPRVAPALVVGAAPTADGGLAAPELLADGERSHAVGVAPGAAHPRLD